MIVWEFRRISTLILELFQVEVLLKWRSQPELMKKPANMKALNSFHLEQVISVFNSVGYAMEIIPKTLATNCGMDVVRIITELRAKHAEKGNSYFGIDGNRKKIADMFAENIWEPIAVKLQVVKTSIEASCLLLRIDDVISGVKKREKQSSAPIQPTEEAGDTFGDQRDG